MPSNDGTTPLMLACHAGSLPAARLLRERGGCVRRANSWGCTAAHFAGLGGAGAELVGFLTGEGADFAGRQGGGHTPAHKASLGGFGGTVKAIWEALDGGGRGEVGDARDGDGRKCSGVWRGGEGEEGGREWMEARGW